MCKRLCVALGVLLAGSLLALPLELPEDDTPVPALPTQTVSIAATQADRLSADYDVVSGTQGVAGELFEASEPAEETAPSIDLPAKLEVVVEDANAPSLQTVREELEADEQSPLIDPVLADLAAPELELEVPVVDDEAPVGPAEEIDVAQAPEQPDETLTNSAPDFDQPDILASEPVDMEKIAAQMKQPKDIIIDEPLPTYDSAPTLEESAKEVAAVEKKPATQPSSSRNVFLIDPKITHAAEAVLASARPQAVKPQTRKPLPIPGGRKLDGCFVSADYDLEVMMEASDELGDHFVFGGKPSGLGLFLAREPSQLILMVNHDLGADDAELSSFANQLDRVSSDLLFSSSPMAYGSVTRHVFDRYSGKIVDQSLSLAGTPQNAAGCATPWGTFLSAAGSKPTQQKLFEVDVSYRGLGAPFWKEVEISFQSMVMDASSQIFYFAKDEPIGHLYRIRPGLRNHLSEDMPVEVLCIQRWAGADSRNVDDSVLQMHIDGYYNIYWREVASLANATGMNPATMQNTATRFGAISSMAMSGSSMYFVVPQTGATGQGQLFELKGDTLRLVKEFGEDEPVNPTAIASLKAGRLLVASQLGQGSKLYLLGASGQWKPILLTDSPIDSMVVDPLTGVVYLSLPQEDRVVRLFHKSLGK